jgi:glycosyltransferase involved in cell wall biosynthesis
LNLEQASAVAVANQQIADQLRYRGCDGKPTFILEDGVNTELFCHTPLPNVLTFGWCGNAKAGHGQIKGLDLIEEACKEAGHDLKILDGSKKQIPHEEMPQWYSTISCYICASSWEGTPNPPLEAMACGRPVISTRVGIVERILNDGVNGFFVNRDVESIVDAINMIKNRDMMRMSFAARFAAESHSWTYKIMHWFSALRTLCIG